MQHIGVKIVKAIPMSRQMYNDYRGWELPDNEDGLDEGYLVEYLDGGTANDTRHAGYISWSPEEVFDNAYRKTTGMTFGLAIEALRMGRKVSRAGWNGKGMWLVLVPGNESAKLHRTPFGVATGIDQCEILPHIDMWTVNANGRRAMLPGWLASQTDMLAEDWTLVD